VKKTKLKKRGPARTTGPGTLVGLRCHAPFLEAVDGWRESEDTKPSRPAAIVRLAEIGLSVCASARPHTAKTRAKAADLAAATIDRQTDQSASPEEQASRKRRLLKGPKEFRELRRDHPTPKRKP
jgi:hypothetical protein